MARAILKDSLHCHGRLWVCSKCYNHRLQVASPTFVSAQLPVKVCPSAAPNGCQRFVVCYEGEVSPIEIPMELLYAKIKDSASLSSCK